MISGLSDKIFITTMELLSHSNSATELLVLPRTASVRLNTGEIAKDAHGMAENSLSLLVNKHTLQTPVILGAVIVHELTHCIDFCEVGDMLRTGGSSWTSELNAHMNQGLVLRQLRDNLPASHPLRGDLMTTISSNTTFGNSVDWTTRKMCAKGIKGRYADALGRNGVTGFSDDWRWEKAAGLHYFPSN